ncbi:MAG: translation initiation factor IF-2 N-terminal domain-containing protein, partial [Syntrophales bacterium]|nr:translation initiation factor IF-2 N-terminal domain-containing protein [Syntrophales bacterium]
MTKKRVYEIARELGIDNKEMSAKLEKMGISVKSHSSALEDSDVERIQRAFLAGEPHEIEEKRIKSTVIRRRAVRTAADEEKLLEAQEMPTEDLEASKSTAAEVEPTAETSPKPPEVAVPPMP